MIGLDALMTATREGGSYGMPDPMSQVRDVGQRRQPPQRPEYRPGELEQLAMLQQAVGMGLDPSFAQAEFARITGGLDARQDAFRQRQQTRRANLQSLSQLGPTAAEVATAYGPQVADDMFQGFGGQVERGLDSIIGGVAAPTGGAPALDPQSVQGISQAVAEWTGEGLSLEQVRSLIIGQMRMEGSSPAEIAAAEDFIGQQVSSIAPGLVGNAPVTPNHPYVGTVGGTLSLGDVASSGSSASGTSTPWTTPATDYSALTRRRPGGPMYG